MKENEKRKEIMLKNRHKWIKIGNGYSKCTSCGLVKYQKYKTSQATYSKNNIFVKNVGCTKSIFSTSENDT